MSLSLCKRADHSATPGCGCAYCEAVFKEWGEAAAGFQRWYEDLSPARALDYFGEVREQR